MTSVPHHVSFLRAALSMGDRCQGLWPLPLLFGAFSFLSLPYCGQWQLHTSGQEEGGGDILLPQASAEAPRWRNRCPGAVRERKESVRRQNGRREIFLFSYYLLPGLQEGQHLGCTEGSRAVALHRGCTGCLGLSRTPKREQTPLGLLCFNQHTGAGANCAAPSCRTGGLVCHTPSQQLPSQPCYPVIIFSL